MSFLATIRLRESNCSIIILKKKKHEFFFYNKDSNYFYNVIQKTAYQNKLLG